LLGCPALAAAFCVLIAFVTHFEDGSHMIRATFDQTVKDTKTTMKKSGMYVTGAA
jgi:hypothetical protein